MLVNHAGSLAFMSVRFLPRIAIRHLGGTTKMRRLNNLDNAATRKDPSKAFFKKTGGEFSPFMISTYLSLKIS